MKTILAVLLALFAGLSTAAVPGSLTFNWGSNYAGFYSGTQYASGVLACQNAQRYNNAPYVGASLAAGTGTSHPMTYVCTYSGATVTVYTNSQTLVCPANSTNVSGQCVCSVNYPESNGSCTAAWKASLDALNASGSSLQYSGTSHTTTVCHAGFSVTGTGSVLGLKNGVGFGEVYGPFTGTGAACAGAAVGAAAPIPCKPGEFTGTINGEPVCVPPVSAQTAPEVVTAPASGASDAPTSGIPGAPPTAVTSTGSTTCDGASCTTTTTYKDSGGVVVGVGTKQETMPAFCAANPAASICGPQKTACELDPESIGCRDLDVPTTAVPTREVTATFGVESLGLGDGSCPAPVSFHTSNGDYSISFTKWCDAVTTYVRPLVLVLAAFAALMIAMPRESL